MTITKDDLKTALAQLDTTNNDHWTDDGSPRVSAVRVLAKDDTINRSTINDLMPGYVRPGTEAFPDKKTGTQPGPVTADGDGYIHTADASDDLLVTDEKGDELPDEELKEIMQRRISAAQEAIDAAQAALKVGAMDLRTAQERHAKTIRDLNMRFPPLSFSENIQSHIATQNRMRLEAATGGPSALDQGTAYKVIAARKGRAVAQFSRLPSVR